MSTSFSFQLERSLLPLQAGAYRDEALHDLSSDARLRLHQWHSRDWLSSPGYAQSYSYPPPRRVCYLAAEDGQVLDACFYTASNWAGVFRCMSFACGVDPAGPLLDLLLQTNGADLIRIPFHDGSVRESLASPRVRSILRKMADDHCIQLPASAGNYLGNLGAQTRKHLPYYLRRLRKEWGNSWRFEHLAGNGIAKKTYRELLSLNALRMGRKRRRSLWTPEISEHRWPLVSECGLLGCMIHEERLVAGTLSFMHGRDAYLAVIAHDPDEDRLNLGNLSLWLTIEQLIAKGFERYHLLWGNSPYKKQFGAVARPLFEKIVFPNPRAARVWRAGELLQLEKAQRFTSAAIRRALWILSPIGRASAHKDDPE